MILSEPSDSDRVQICGVLNTLSLLSRCLSDLWQPHPLPVGLPMCSENGMQHFEEFLLCILSSAQALGRGVLAAGGWQLHGKWRASQRKPIWQKSLLSKSVRYAHVCCPWLAIVNGKDAVEPACRSEEFFFQKHSLA